MNKSLQQLTESTLKSGLLQLNPDLAQEFKVAKETFSSLAKTASEGQYDIDEDGEPGGEGTGSQKAAESERQDVGWGYSATSQSSSKVCWAYRKLSQTCFDYDISLIFKNFAHCVI